MLSGSRPVIPGIGTRFTGAVTGRTYGWLSPPTCCLRDGGFTVGLEGNAGQAVGLGGPADAVAEVGVDLDLDRVRACLQVRSRVDGARGLVDRVDRVPVDGDGDDHVTVPVGEGQQRAVSAGVPAGGQLEGARSQD